MLSLFSPTLAAALVATSRAAAVPTPTCPSLEVTFEKGVGLDRAVDQAAVRSGLCAAWQQLQRGRAYAAVAVGRQRARVSAERREVVDAALRRFFGGAVDTAGAELARQYRAAQGVLENGAGIAVRLGDVETCVCKDTPRARRDVILDALLADRRMCQREVGAYIRRGERDSHGRTVVYVCASQLAGTSQRAGLGELFFHECMHAVDERIVDHGYGAEACAVLGLRGQLGLQNADSYVHLVKEIDSKMAERRAMELKRDQWQRLFASY